jgi:glycosyltransferase involved in cell wall biosynthesis
MDPKNGGPCQGIRNSIPEMQRLGVDNEVVSLDSPNAAFLGKDPFKIHAIGAGNGPWFYNEALLPWLLDNLSSYSAVIIHGLWQYHGYATRKAIKQLKEKGVAVPKVYVMPHGMLDPYFQRAAGRKLKAIRNVLYWKLLESHTINKSDGVLFTCQEELLLAKTTFSPYHPKEELNVGYGIQTPPGYVKEMSDSFKALCPELSGPYVLFLSRIHEKKGVDLLINSYVKLKATNPRIPSLVIAGPGMDSEYGKNLAQSAKGTTGIYFPGMLSGNSKWGAFYGCQAFVLPSHQENFGIALVEAMACGAPVMITDKVNIWREVKNNNAGLVGPDTEEGIYNLLDTWFAKTNDEILNYGEAGKTVFNKYYEISKATANLLSVLNNA